MVDLPVNNSEIYKGTVRKEAWPRSETEMVVSEEEVAAVVKKGRSRAKTERCAQRPQAGGKCWAGEDSPTGLSRVIAQE